ncbi:hypothetical protein HH212_09875 [Massilia forsythiae]|uniref:Immunity protein 43 domain-containing protein n=1 Tax=Massilia forsythiae TaxID=2728020 RepID=A0A7Z2VW55_9BURK|nr:hypothetical protein [Massilia forsythiae]QJE00289.1 hypothetical protein HH212_09875 [Massilia forsythiae]
MTEKNFYVLKYTDKNAGCPTFLSAELTPSETEWELFVPNPFNINIKNKYILKIIDPDIENIAFDMDSSDQKYVSKQFLNVCDSLSISYRAIPLEILFTDGRKTTKDYFFFLPGKNIELLDRKKSSFKEEKVLGSNQTEMNGVFPSCPIYSKIERFVPVQTYTENLFFCIEIFEIVCTESFRKIALQKNLIGIDFLPIDEDYQYNPWNE